MIKVDDCIHLSQPGFIRDVLTKFKMDECSAVSMPMADPRILFENNIEQMTDAPYRAAIGSLLYTAMSVRPDILFATILLSRFNEKPKQVH